MNSLIISKVENLQTYVQVNPYMKDLIHFFEINDWQKLEEGVIPILEEKVFGNCFTYVADGASGDFFETHYKYLDVHLVIENTEDMAVSTAQSTTISQTYDEAKDIEFYQGKVEQLVHLNLDVHLVIENTEDMAVSTAQSTTISQTYDEAKDIEFYQGKVEQLVHLNPGDCLITFPEDLHQPKVKVNAQVVKKAVFKLAITNSEEDCHGNTKT